MPSNSRLKKAARQLAEREGMTYADARRRLLGDAAAQSSKADIPFSTVQAKRLADAQYVLEQRKGLYLPYVARLNRLVDALAEESGHFVPHLAPTYGGVKARILTIFDKPGSKTLPDGGSGMLSVENPDQAAARFLALFQGAGLDVKDLVSWNIYPWSVTSGGSSVPSRRKGVQSLKRLLELLPDLGVVVAHGTPAKTGWEAFTRSYPDVAARYEYFGTISTGPRALSAPQRERARREAELLGTYSRVADLLRR